MVIGLWLACSNATSAGDLDVSAFVKTACDSGDPSCDPALAVTVSGASVHVEESGVTLTCCMDTAPVVTLEGTVASVEYAESGEACDCVCTHGLAYDIGPFESGTWTIRTVTGDQDITVP